VLSSYACYSTAKMTDNNLHTSDNGISVHCAGGLSILMPTCYVNVTSVTQNIAVVSAISFGIFFVILQTRSADASNGDVENSFTDQCSMLESDISTKQCGFCDIRVNCFIPY